MKFSPPLLGVIRRDAKVAEAIRHQTPLFTRSPRCEAACDINAITLKLLSEFGARTRAPASQ